MFENVVNFFKKIGKKEKIDASSKDTAKERLHLVLMQDRANVSADFLDMMRQEIIDVIKKYIDVDENEIDVRLTNRQNEDGTTGAPALYANIPIAGIKEEKIKEHEKEIEEQNRKEVEKDKKDIKKEKNKEDIKLEEQENKRKETEKSETNEEQVNSVKIEEKIQNEEQKTENIEENINSEDKKEDIKEEIKVKEQKNTENAEKTESKTE